MIFKLEPEKDKVEKAMAEYNDDLYWTFLVFRETPNLFSNEQLELLFAKMRLYRNGNRALIRADLPTDKQNLSKLGMVLEVIREEPDLTDVEIIGRVSERFARDVNRQDIRNARCRL